MDNSIDKLVSVLMVGDSLKHNGGITTVEKMILQYRTQRMNFSHVATHEGGSAIHRIKVFAQGLLSLVSKLFTQPVDIIHIHLADWGSVVRKSIVISIAMIFNKAIVVHAHGPEFHLTYEALPTFAQRLLSWLLRQSNQFIVLSESWKRFYVEHLNLDENQVTVLPNPIELPRTIPDRRNATRLNLVFMGRIGQRKGAFDLIRAFGMLPKNHQQPIHLFLAGDGEIDQARCLVEDLHLQDQVTFLGWIDTEARNRLLSQAHLFVLPSYNEALPMALLEAMAWKLPVVTCPVGGISDFVVPNQNGLLVQPGNIQQLSEALQRLIEDESLRESFGESAQRRISALNIEEYISKLEIIFDVCVTQKSKDVMTSNTTALRPWVRTSYFLEAVRNTASKK